MPIASSFGEAVVIAPTESSFVRACNNILQEEWFTLHAYLSEVNEGWLDLLSSWKLEEQSRDTDWKRFAVPLLVARRSLAMLTAAGRYAVTDRWAEWKRAYRNSSRYDSTVDFYFKVIEADPVFAEEARDLSNPDVTQTVDLCEGMSPQDTKLLETAIELIKLVNGRCREVVSAGLDTLAILELPPKMSAGSCISFTSRSAPGAIFLTMTAPILLAESIVHEAVHNVLYTATRLSQVTLGGRRMLRSPLRKDLRPLEGVIHQAVVLDYLCEFYDQLLQYPSIDSVSRNISQITKRLYKCREDQHMALNEICEVADDLGPLGLEIVGILHRKIATY